MQLSVKSKAVVIVDANIKGLRNIDITMERGVRSFCDVELEAVVVSSVKKRACEIAAGKNQS